MDEQVVSLTELETYAKQFAANLFPHKDSAALVTLSGELGAGKTTFTQALARALGVTDVVNSPTFVLEKIYPLPGGGAFRKLVHIDAYRLEGGKDLEPLGFDALMRDAGNLVLLEWPEKVKDALPHPTQALAFSVQSNDTRCITCTS